MKMAKEALLIFLHSLPVDSYFNVLLFGSTYDKMFEESKKYDDDTLQFAKKFANDIYANLGGTEIFAPLDYILKLPVKTAGPGQVFNTHECVELVRRHSPSNRVFCLGLGAAADR